jgi:hypothetical protein
VLLLAAFQLLASGAELNSFQEGCRAYEKADYTGAANAFRSAAALQPSSGVLQNLGNAEWQRNQPGPAILAWEQALWLNPYDRAARANLRFARKVDQLESPDYAWYEVVSTWLPVDWWAWLAAGGLWVAIGMVLLPSVFRLHKTSWQQAVSALALMVFLLSVPAQFGVFTRARLGFIVEPETPLLLTPTVEGQPVTQLASGEPARCERTHGDFLLVQTSHGKGWVQKERFGLVYQKPRQNTVLPAP